MVKFNVKKIKKKMKLGRHAGGMGGFVVYKYLNWSVNKHKKRFEQACELVYKNKGGRKEERYWREVVLDSYFGNKVAGSDAENISFILKMREFMEEFLPRVKENCATAEDKKIIKEILKPFMRKAFQAAKLKAIELADGGKANG